MIEVTTEEMMHARDVRQKRQLALLKPDHCLISLTLNIAGPIKLNDEIKDTFIEAIRLIENQISADHLLVIESSRWIETTGCSAMWLIHEDPRLLKKKMIFLEERTAFTRLLDIDVLDDAGHSISREDLQFKKRKCLLCDLDAHLCARNRTHSMTELQAKTHQIITENFLNKKKIKLTQIAMSSILNELATSPKPGLVDRFDSGAHKDMNYFTFIQSSTALAFQFDKFILAGFNRGNQPLDEFLLTLQCIGKQIEAVMFEATGNINTHKGTIFSFGLFLGIIASYLPIYTTVPFSLIQEELCQIGELILHNTPNENTEKTNGQRCAEQYQVLGVRKEVASGYPSVFNHSLPYYRRLLKQGFQINEAGIMTLLLLICCIEDTNIMSRSNKETSEQLQAKIKMVLPILETPSQVIHYAEELNQEFIQLNVSPGGSADLLALTFFLDECELQQFITNDTTA